MSWRRSSPTSTPRCLQRGQGSAVSGGARSEGRSEPLVAELRAPCHCRKDPRAPFAPGQQDLTRESGFWVRTQENVGGTHRPDWIEVQNPCGSCSLPN